jgi:CRP-like cAMP-binding protein
MRERHFAKGATIFREGDASGEAYLIRAGRIEVLKETPGGPLCLTVLGEGDVLGEMGLLEDRPRSASARAAAAGVADAIDREEFLHLLLEKPEDALGLLRALFERLRTVNQMLADLSAPVAGAGAVPGVVLYPLTPEGERAIGADRVAVTRFPFRVGRRPDGRQEAALAFNEVELPDDKPYRVALNHFAIDLGASGGTAGLVLRDRGSHQGTLVNGRRIGSGEARDQAPLRAGDNEVALGPGPAPFGAPREPYRFKIVVEGA